MRRTTLPWGLLDARRHRPLENLRVMCIRVSALCIPWYASILSPLPRIRSAPRGGGEIYLPFGIPGMHTGIEEVPTLARPR